MKKFLIFLTPFLMLTTLACSDQKEAPEHHPKKHENHAQGHDESHGNHAHQHGEGHHGNHANEHMHQSSTEDLIKHFEAPERDEWQKPDQVLDYLGELEGRTVMDIGAGSGYFSVKLAERGAKVIAADVDDEFLESIQKRIEDNELERIEVRKIPYDSPDLSDEEADIVLIVNTYHHIDKRTDYFSKVKKGTKKNGELVIVDFFKTELPVGPKPDHKISMDVVIAELKAAGYSRFEVNVELLPYQYIIRAK